MLFAITALEETSKANRYSRRAHHAANVGMNNVSLNIPDYVDEWGE